MTCSKTMLGGQIRKIIVTDKDDPKAEPIEIKGTTDAETILEAHGTIEKITDKAHKAIAEVHYLGTVLKIGFPHENANRTCDSAH